MNAGEVILGVVALLVFGIVATTFIAMKYETTKKDKK